MQVFHQQTTDGFRQTPGHTWAYTKYIVNTERMFKEYNFKIVIRVKDTANPLTHHALALLNFFNWM